MLNFSERQICALRASQVSSFAHEMTCHAQQFCPKLVIGLSLIELNGIVKETIGQAQIRGFTRRGPLRLWIEFSFMFGSGFVDDPLLPWIGAQFDASVMADQMDRAWQLHAAWPLYRDTVLGPSNLYYLTALRRLAAICEVDTREHLLSHEHIVHVMGNIYPERFCHAGLAAHQKLVDQALAVARRVGPHSPSDVFLLALLMSFFGHDCFTDARHGWLGRALYPVGEVGVPSDFESLRRSSVAYLKAVLRNSGEW